MPYDKRLWPHSFSPKGEIALVSSGGSGLGLGIARCLAAAGAHVVLAGRRTEPLEKAARAIGPTATPMVFDLTTLKALPDFIRQIEGGIGPLSALANNAGVHLKKPAADTSDVELAQLVDIHLSVSYALARETARSMLQRQRGSILFIGSMASLFGIPQVSAYTAVKAAVVGLVRCLAVEWSSRGVRINALVPGWIDTGMVRDALGRDRQRMRRVLSRTPMHRLGSEEDVGWAAVFLCSPAARFITGAALTVDGGASIGF